MKQGKIIEGHIRSGNFNAAIAELEHYPNLGDLLSPPQAANPDPEVCQIRENLLLLHSINAMMQERRQLDPAFAAQAMRQLLQQSSALLEDFNPACLDFAWPTDLLASPNETSIKASPKAEELELVEAETLSDDLQQASLSTEQTVQDDGQDTAVFPVCNDLKSDASESDAEFTQTFDEILKDDSKLFEFLEELEANFDQLLAEANPVKILMSLAVPALYRKARHSSSADLLTNDKQYKIQLFYQSAQKRLADKLRADESFQEAVLAFTLANLSVLYDPREEEALSERALRKVYKLVPGEHEPDSLYGLVTSPNNLKKLSLEQRDSLVDLVLYRFSIQYPENQDHLRLALNLLETKVTRVKELEDYLLRNFYRARSHQVDCSLSKTTLLQVLAYLVKYRKTDLEEKLIDAMVNIPEDLNSGQGWQAWLNHRVEGKTLLDELRRSNPVPEIFQLHHDRLVFADDLQAKLRPRVKAKLEEVFAGDPNLAAYPRQGGIDFALMVEMLERVNAMGLNTAGLLGDDRELAKRIKSSFPPSGVIFRTAGDERLHALCHHAHKMSILDPHNLAYGTNERANKIYQSLSKSKIIPKDLQSPIEDEALTELIDLNIEAAKAKPAEYGKKLFYSYLEAEERQELLEQFIAREEESGERFVPMTYFTKDLESYGLSLEELFAEENKRCQSLFLVKEQRQRAKRVILDCYRSLDSPSLFTGKLYDLKQEELPDHLKDYAKALLANPKAHQDQYPLAEKLKALDHDSPHYRKELREVFEQYFALITSPTEAEFWKLFDAVPDTYLFNLVDNIQLYAAGNRAASNGVRAFDNEFFSSTEQELTSVVASLNEQSFLHACFSLNLKSPNLPWLQSLNQLERRLNINFAQAGALISKAETFANQLPYSSSSVKLEPAFESRALVNQAAVYSTRAPDGTDYLAPELGTLYDLPSRPDWNATARLQGHLNGRVYGKKFTDPGMVESHEYHIDLPSLASSGDHEEQIRKLLTFLYHQCFKPFQRNPIVEFSFKGKPVLSLNKLDLIKIFGASTRIQDQYTDRSYFADFYLTLYTLLKLAASSDPYRGMKTPLLPKNYRTRHRGANRIVVCADDDQIKLSRSTLMRLNKSNGAEILRLNLEPIRKGSYARLAKRREPEFTRRK